MRRLLFAAMLAAVPSVAWAQDVGVAYVEGSVGLLLIPNVETEPFTIDTGFGIFEGDVELDYGEDFTFGFEGGYSTGVWRFALSYDYSNAELDSATVSGTLDGDPFEENVTHNDLNDFGISADNTLQLFQAHAFYNLPLLGPAIRPYVGVGAGMAAIEHADSELAFSATVGARFALSEAAYLGAKYRFTFIAGPTDDGGTRFENFALHTFSVLIGFYIGG
jgi:opacity protein-like surface antigen